MISLGLSGLFHDSSASLVVNGAVVAAVHEERHSRVKHDARFPINALNQCLEISGLNLSEVDEIIWYEDIDKKQQRNRELISRNFPNSFSLFRRIKSVEFKSNANLVNYLRNEIGYRGNIQFSKHHESHFLSTLPLNIKNYEKILGIVLDGVGEYQSCSAWLYSAKGFKLVWERNLPNSLGLLYGAVTQIVGFEVNDGEYKTMGLASYGIPKFSERILSDVFSQFGLDFEIRPEYLNLLSSDVQFKSKLLKVFCSFFIKRAVPSGELSSIISIFVSGKLVHNFGIKFSAFLYS